jgi:hypothetical protein
VPQPATVRAAQAVSRSVVPGAHRTCGRIPLGRPPGDHGSAVRQQAGGAYGGAGSQAADRARPVIR